MSMSGGGAPRTYALPAIGDRFGRWTVTGAVTRAGSQSRRFIQCTCDCGILSQVSVHRLVTGRTNSCGCAPYEKRHARVVANRQPPPRIGDTFGRWVVNSDPFFDENGRRFVHCRCECGNASVQRIDVLRRGSTRSCGCLSREVASALMRTHGGTGTRLYSIWRGMLDRCTNPREASFPRYGGRGIAVCSEWGTFQTFRQWSLANGYGDDLQIDRINNNGNYEPSNCRWVTFKENARNKRTTRLIEAFGECKSMAEWLDDPRCVSTRSMLHSRISLLGWPTERALTQPLRRRRR